MSTPAISFVLINYNYECFISEAALSIFRQSFRNFECKIIDNNSSDESLNKIPKEICHDSRFTVIENDENLNQMGAFLSILDDLEGDYVAIIDSDDFIFEDYAAYHIQAHLSSSPSIGLSSNAVLEVDADGRPLSAGYAPFLRHTIGRPFRASPNIASAVMSDIGRGKLENCAVFIPSTETGWHWSPGTAIVYSRKFLLQARPRYDGGPYVAATDNYYAPFVHALGNSVCIDLPLSAYRIHGKNRHGAMSTLPTLRTATRSGFDRSRARRQDITETMVSRANEFLSLYPDTFWSLMDVPALADGLTLNTYFESPGVQAILERHYPTLCQACGQEKTELELSRRMSSRHLGAFKARIAKQQLRTSRILI